jgi:hypothetical protein
LSLNLVPFRFSENPPNYKASTMNHQSLTQRFFRYVPALFTLTALGLVGWAVVDRPAPSTTAAAVSLTTTSAADGTLPAAGADVRRRIEDDRVGDLVWAYDEQTGQLEKRQVTALFRSQTEHLRVLTLESGSGERQRIETTDEHPFWVVGYGWQDAQLLRPGDRLLEPNQSQVTVISSVREEHPDGLTVYNFEVAGLHDYFVSATATDSLVLSHNMCRRGGDGASKPNVGSTRHVDLEYAGNGGYKVEFESGIGYAGKGGTNRARQSARRHSRENNDPVTKIEHFPANNDKDAFDIEATFLKELGGNKSPRNYNRIDSPGTPF